MVAISTTARERIRRSGAVLLILGLVLGMVGVLAGTASAIDTGGTFELDGNPQDAPATPGDDWSTLFTSATIPAGTAGNSLGRAFVPDLEANDTTYFQGGGSKDQSFIQGPPAKGGPWGWSGSAPDKDDITNAYAASYLTTSGTIVAFGADRFDASGDAQMGFWFFKNAISTTGTAGGAAQPFVGEHTQGDVLVLANFSNGGTSATVTAYQWVGTGGSDGTLDLLSTGGVCNGSASQEVCAVTNGATETSPWPYVDKDGATSFQKNAFVEGAINISALFPGDECFTSFLAETRSSTSVSATLKDFALGSFHSCPTPTLATTSNPTGTNVAPGTAVTDTLTVTGVSQNGFPSGTATFWLCAPNETSATVGCPDGQGTKVSTATVAGDPNGFTGTAQATAPGSMTQAEGTYCWRASYTPGANALYTAPDGSHTNNGTECFTVVKPNVKIDKTADNSPITAGDTASFTITVTNDGPGTATSVTVSDTPLPSGVAWSDNSNDCSISSGALSCSFGNLTSGSVRSVVISGVTDAADCGTLPNTATVSATNERANSSSDNTDSASIVVQCPNVRVDKTAADDSINAGETASFTITTTNDGPGTATNVVTTDTLPGGITWAEDSSDCSISGGVLTCSWGNLTSGTVKTVHVSGPTTASNCGTLNNTAWVSATNEGTNRGDNSDGASIVVNCGTINLKKTANPAGPVTAGSQIGFTIEVWNSGAGDVTSATVTDTLPTNAGTSWTLGGADSGACAIDGGVLTCSFGTIKSTDTTKTVTLSSPTTPATCGLVSNTAHVSTTNDGSASSTATVTVECPDVHVSKVGNGPIVAGDQAVFTIGAGNSGPGTATNVALHDNLPAGLTWSETLDPSNACTVSTGTSQTLSCNWQSVAGGTTNTVTITATSSPGNCPSISNTATVSAANEPTGDQSDNSASATINVNCADVHVSKAGNGPLVAGNKATFTIGVGNAGPTTASVVTLTDNLPAGLTWAEDPSVTECTVTSGSAQVLSCTWSEIAPSTTKTVSVSGTTVVGNCPSISNTATVAARNETTSNQTDNSASATINVTCPTPPPPPPPPPPTTTTTEAPTTTTTQPPQVLPEVITTTTLPPTTTTTSTTIKVLGVQLARTGNDTGVWVRLAGIFLFMGGLLLVGSDRRLWTLRRRP
jgi:uncharacterized repeat protein (TIGR01451 family)